MPYFGKMARFSSSPVALLFLDVCGGGLLKNIGCRGGGGGNIGKPNCPSTGAVLFGAP